MNREKVSIDPAAISKKALSQHRENIAAKQKAKTPRQKFNAIVKGKH